MARYYAHPAKDSLRQSAVRYSRALRVACLPDIPSRLAKRAKSLILNAHNPQAVDRRLRAPPSGDACDEAAARRSPLAAETACIRRRGTAPVAGNLRHFPVETPDRPVPAMPSSLAGIASFPRIRLGHTPTPFDPAPNLGAVLGIDLWIKRDDLHRACSRRQQGAPARVPLR